MELLRQLIAMNRILVVAAHPDDEVLGCGGTIARMSKEGHEVYTLILGEGLTSRETVVQSRRQQQLLKLEADLQRANRLLGVKRVMALKLPDNRFDSIARLDIIKAIEKVKKDLKPQIIFTHFAGDLNIDHQITCQAVLTATRPIKGETVREVYAFEVRSSTEWNYPEQFAPDTFVDISSTLKLKLKAMCQYSSELKNSWHPRSVEGITTTARLWGLKTGLLYCEAFRTLRRLL